MRRIDGNVCHFITLTVWESLDAIRGFAGEDIAKPKYYPEDENFLLESLKNSARLAAHFSMED